MPSNTECLVQSHIIPYHIMCNVISDIYSAKSTIYMYIHIYIYTYTYIYIYFFCTYIYIHIRIYIYIYIYVCVYIYMCVCVVTEYVIDSMQYIIPNT